MASDERVWGFERGRTYDVRTKHIVDALIEHIEGAEPNDVARERYRHLERVVSDAESASRKEEGYYEATKHDQSHLGEYSSDYKNRRMAEEGLKELACRTNKDTIYSVVVRAMERAGHRYLYHPRAYDYTVPRGH